LKTQFDDDLGDLTDDADNAYNPEWVGHMYVTLRQFGEIARSVSGRRGLWVHKSHYLQRCTHLIGAYSLLLFPATPMTSQ
jgi:hypothetical protein